jgi:hypothetical protein
MVQYLQFRVLKFPLIVFFCCMNMNHERTQQAVTELKIVIQGQWATALGYATISSIEW